MLFNVVSNKSKKYPIKIKFSKEFKVKVPSQHNFEKSFIQDHGCSLAAFYMGLQFIGVKKSMNKCLEYLEKNYDLNGRSKYSLEQIFNAINKICKGRAVFYKSISKTKLKQELKNGNMLLFEEKDPIHSAVLLWNGNKIFRFSDGKYKKVTAKHEINIKCTDGYYGGCVIVKRKG